MTSFKRYFFYHFRSTLLRGAVIAVISIALTMAFVTSSLYQRATDIYIYTDVGFLGVAAAVLCRYLTEDEAANRDDVVFLAPLPIFKD